MAEITVNEITEVAASCQNTGVAASAGGDSYKNESGVFVYIANGDNVLGRVITIAAPVSNTITKFGTLPVDDLVLQIGAGNFWVFSVPKGYEVDGMVNMTYDDQSLLLVSAWKIP